MLHLKWARASHRSAQLLISTALLCSAFAVADAQATGSDTAVPVNKSTYLTVDGARLYMLTRGRDARAPLLLWLHGGPGGAERPLFRYYNGSLEDQFVVTYLDQRGAGRSYDPDADPKTLTIERHIKDLNHVVDWLRQKFHQHKIFLVGHSWGATLGILYAQRYPDKVAALVAVAPLVNTRKSEVAQYRFVRDKANEVHDTRTLKALDKAGQPPYHNEDNAMIVNRLAEKYGAVFHRRPNKFAVMLLGMLRGLVTPWEIPNLIRGNNVSLKAMNDELLDVNLEKSVPRLDMPVYFLLGRYDHHVSAEVAADYFKQLEAPKKELVWFEHSAHNIPFEEPQRFDDTVERLLL